MSLEFDLVVIGSGPGGYVGAIRGAQLGMKVALIEKENTLGGTCLNVGCIPSKALLQSSEHYYELKTHPGEHGFEFENLRLNLEKMMGRKNKIVKDLTSGIAYLMKKNKITTFQGRGRLVSANSVEVLQNQESQILKTRHILLATGSVPNALPQLPYNGTTIIHSTQALSLQEVPKKLLVVGAGVIGLELGSVWSRLGSSVTVIEFGSKIAGGMDEGLSLKLKTLLSKQGLEFIMESSVTQAQVLEKTKNKVRATYRNLNTQEENHWEGDVILVAAGRKPYAQDLGLETLGLKLNDRGALPVDEHYRTTIPSLYAVGDLIPGPMLAHKAEEEAVAAVENMAGQAGHVNYDTLPSVVYTDPEFASVGLTEQELQKKGVHYRSGVFPFSANGRAKALGKTEGQVKILADEKSDKVLGVHILGPQASDLIQEAVILMEFSGSAEDLARSFHGHPTLSEVMREAALNVEKRARQM